MEDKERLGNFLDQIDKNQGILHKVSRVYCSKHITREDLFQEILLQLWKSFQTFRGESKFSTWMYRVAINTAITLYHRNEKRSLEDSIETYCYAMPDKSDEDDEQVQMLYQAIGQLGQAEKALIMLHLDDYSYEEIAEISGITVSNVGVKLHRIKTKLQQLIQKMQQEWQAI